MTTDYKLLAAYDPVDLQNAVNNDLVRGYSVSGGVGCGAFEGRLIFTQALTATIDDKTTGDHMREAQAQLSRAKHIIQSLLVGRTVDESDLAGVAARAFLEGTDG